MIIIDPGDDADYIINQINDSNKKPSKIVATHGHFDHLLAATEVVLAYDIPLLLHKDDEFLLKRLQSSAKHFIGVETDPPPTVGGYLTEGEKIILGRYKFKIISTPGHTPGGVALYCKEAKTLFVGDTVFDNGGVGRTDFKYADSEELVKSIKILLKLPGDTVVYPGHGDKTTITEVKSSLLQIL